MIKKMMLIIQLFNVREEYKTKVWMLKNNFLKMIQNGFNHLNLIQA